MRSLTLEVAGGQQDYPLVITCLRLRVPLNVSLSQCCKAARSTSKASVLSSGPEGLSRDFEIDANPPLMRALRRDALKQTTRDSRATTEPPQFAPAAPPAASLSYPPFGGYFFGGTK